MFDKAGITVTMLSANTWILGSRKAAYASVAMPRTQTNCTRLYLGHRDMLHAGWHFMKNAITSSGNIISGQSREDPAPKISNGREDLPTQPRPRF